MKKNNPVVFSNVEIGHILQLISNNEREGCYYGPKYQYFGRSEKIRKMLQDSITKQDVIPSTKK